MKRKITISDRAIGPVVRGSLKKHVARANGVGTSAVSYTEDQKGQIIQFTLKNTSNEDKVFAVFPGMFDTVEDILRYAGLKVDAIAVEGALKDADGETIGSCSSKTLNLAKKWIAKHPMLFCMVKLQTDNEAQFSKEFGIATFKLAKQAGQESIRPLDHISPAQLNKTLCELSTNIQLDDQTVFYMEVAAQRELQVSMQIFGEMNDASALEEINAQD